jgi:catechol-2,3-dioxygenase
MATRTELFRLNGAVERDPAINRWMKEHAGELGAIAQKWFEVMRKCGDEVRELDDSHTQVLALFDRSESPGNRRTDTATSTIDHIAFEIPLAYFADELKRLEGLGFQVETAEHAWVHWRSLYVSDPEGNQVELVCYDASV